MKKMKVKLTMIEPILGSTPSNPDTLRKFVAGNSEDATKIAEESAVSVENEEAAEGEERPITIFPKMEDGTPFLWDYQVKGFFKSACQACNMANPGSKLPAFKKKIDLMVFVDERKIPFVMPEGGEISTLIRPLRAQTAQGERIALAESEVLPAGTTVEFTVTCLDDSLMKRVCDWLDYGRYNGLGQWRNARYGSFTWTEVTE